MKKNILFNRLNDGFLKGGDRMIRSIVKDEKFLAKKCKPATKKDLAIGQDLLIHCVQTRVFVLAWRQI